MLYWSRCGAAKSILLVLWLQRIFRLLKASIGGVVGHEVTLISSAKEAARDVTEILDRHHQRAQAEHKAEYEFNTTGDDVTEFRSFGSLRFLLHAYHQRVPYRILEQRLTRKEPS